MRHTNGFYFGDLIRKETGKTAQEHIKLHTLEAIKRELADSSKTITYVAYDLGFQYPQHLSRFFKKEMGISPAEYRQQSIASRVSPAEYRQQQLSRDIAQA